MAQVKRSPLEDRTNRKKLKARHEPYWMKLEPGRALGYRKGVAGGVWLAKLRVPGASPERRKVVLGTADDHSDADGTEILSYAQAQEKARAWFLAETKEPEEAPSALTVQEAVRAYLKAREQQGMKTVRNARQRAERWIYPELGKVEVSKLTRLRLEQWRDKVGAAPAHRRGGKAHAGKQRPEPSTPEEKRARRASANRIMAVLKAALTWAKDRSLVKCSDDAWRRCKPFPGVAVARSAYLTPDDQVRLINAIQDPDFRRLVTAALMTGARYGELTRMQVADFDPNPDGVASVLIRETKAGKSRRALLTQEGRGFFEGITAGRPKEELIFLKAPDGRLRVVKRGDLQAMPWASADQIRRMNAACAAAGLPRMGFHQLRHSYASALVTAGMPLAMVAKLTGHADTRMLELHYAHLAQSDLSRALEALAPKFGLERPKVEALKVRKVVN